MAGEYTQGVDQVMREAPYIEAAKKAQMEGAKGLVDSANARAAGYTPGQFLNPDYEVAGLTQDQTDAIAAGRAGIGAYQPYMDTADQLATSSKNALTDAQNTLAGADTRGQFDAARSLITQGSSAGIADLAASQGYNASTYGGASAGPAERFYGENAYAAQLGAAPTGQYQQFGGARDVNAERVNTGSFTNQGTAGSYMSPYMQNVVDIQQREAQRQADIAGTARKSAATSRGAFGGSRSAIMDAEADRNLATQKGDIQAQGQQAAYQQAQQQFNAEQGYGLQAQQANQQTGLSAQQSNQGMDYNTAMQNAQLRQQMGLANQAQQGQYGLQQGQFNQAANAQTSAQRQAAGMGNQQAGNQMAQYNAANLQQAGLQNAALGSQAGQFGAASSNQAALANAQANNQMAQYNANARQQAGLGLGSLGTQQFNIGNSMAQGLGSLATQQGNLALQTAGLGQTQQGLGQQDTNFLYNLGSAQKSQTQAELDAERQNVLQKNMQPYQQLGFLSDIYKGAPSTQMGTTMTAQAAPSPFQQAAGLGIGAITAAAGAKTLKLF